MDRKDDIQRFESGLNYYNMHLIDSSLLDVIALSNRLTSRPPTGVCKAPEDT